MDRDKTIVVVDDDREVRTVIELALAKPGRTVLGFGDGQEALDFLGGSDGGVDLVVSDVAMEGFDGHRLLRHLRANSKTAATPVIFVTAADGSTDRIGSVGEPAVEMLRKPFDIDDLRARAESALRRAGNAAPARDPATGLHMRPHFESTLASALREAVPDGPSLSLLVGQLDGVEGDDVLQRIADIFAMHLRATDVAARIGDRRFATLHPSCDAAGATAIAERIIAAVAADPKSTGASVRLALAVAPDPHRTTASALFSAADEALRAPNQDGVTKLTLRTVR